MAINPSEFKPSSGPPPLPPPPSDPEHQRRMEWLRKVRLMHRNKRMLGFAGIILGASMVVWARLSPGEAPGWVLYGGVGLLALSWIVFVYVIIDRSRWIRNNPYLSGGDPAP
jgi:hypothetical protein